MIVISDGDLIANQTDKEKKQVYPLGYDKYASKAFKEPVEFANKKFFLKLCRLPLRRVQLDRGKKSKKIELTFAGQRQGTKAEKTKWQVINMVLPILGLLHFWVNQCVDS